jgi:hypothetical protein
LEVKRFGMSEAPSMLTKRMARHPPATAKRLLAESGKRKLQGIKYLNRKLGKVPTLLTRGPNASSSALLAGARPTQEDLRDAGLLEMDELTRIFERGKRRLLVLAAGQRPLILERWLYYQDEMFAGMFDT